MQQKIGLIRFITGLLLLNSEELSNYCRYSPKPYSIIQRCDVVLLSLQCQCLSRYFGRGDNFVKVKPVKNIQKNKHRAIRKLN